MKKSNANALNIVYGASESPSYANVSSNPDGGGVPVGTGQSGGWFIPRTVIDEKTSDVVDAFRFVFEHGGGVGNIAVNASRAVTKDTYNSVTPHWRDAVLMSVLSV